jgi:hypothetical protein
LKTLYLLVLLLPAVFFLLQRVDPAELYLRHRAKLRVALIAVSVGMIVLVVGGGLLVAKMELPGLSEEPTVLSIVAAFHHGQDIYPAPGSAVDYVLLYGPALYLVYLPPLLLGAEHIGAFEFWAAAALAATFVFLYLGLRARVRRSVAIGCCGLLAIFALRFPFYEWGVKADVWILLFTAFSVWSIQRLPRWLACVVVAMAGAAMIDMKITELSVAGLLCILLWERGRAFRLPAVVALCLTPVFTLLPFAQHQISLAGYRMQIHIAAHRPFDGHAIVQNLGYAALFVLPLVALCWLAFWRDSDGLLAWLRTRWLFAGAVALAIPYAVITGAKAGGGGWHVMPVVIPLLVLVADVGERLRAAPAQRVTALQATPIVALCVALTVTGLSSARVGVRVRLRGDDHFLRVPLPAVDRDIEGILARHPHMVMQMGYSDTVHLESTFARPVLQMRGSPLFIDGVSRNESDLMGQELPAAVIERLRRCDIQMWLIPKEGEPFTLTSYYFPDKLLYPAAFRDAFFATYEKSGEQSAYFDLWKCRKAQ